MFYANVYSFRPLTGIMIFKVSSKNTIESFMLLVVSVPLRGL